MSTTTEQECRQNFLAEVKETHDLFEVFKQNLSNLREMLEDAIQNPDIIKEYSDELKKAASYADQKTFEKLFDLYDDFCDAAVNVLNNWDDCAQFDKNFVANYLENLPEIINPHMNVVDMYTKGMIEIFSETAGSGHTYAARSTVLPFNQSVQIKNPQPDPKTPKKKSEMKFKF